ncbi:MAG: 3-hydroxybutyryl-CoA dehydrogenase [Pseudooceanicola sp.]|jgi:3-hydroxyacyl-CoA dehydrogenase|nr:3-hydroxybutyryl-CoA dehydrogenase [Pseudooceanicola sp.]
MIADRPIGVLGGGLIGQSWASLFAAQGARVIVVDSAPGADAAMAAFVQAAWPDLCTLGLAQGEAPVIAVSDDINALQGVQFVQENLPDRIDIKHREIARLEGVIGADTIIASSSSSLMPSEIQDGAAHPGRILVAHPMNPPHLVPMVELVAGRQTAPETVDRAEAVYRAMKRVTIRARKEVRGHIANRLTSALYREAVHMVAEGIADVADIDRAIAYGPGMRWALMGPHLTYHMGGGAGGYRHYLTHLGPTQEARWAELGQSALTPDLIDKLVAGVEHELAEMDPDTLTRRRDAALVALNRLKTDHRL